MNSDLVEKMMAIQRKAYRPKFANAKSGWITVAGRKFFARSQWEKDYARYLAWMEANGKIKGWAHEPKTFWFEGIRRGVTNYKPDFRVDYLDGSTAWAEIKGWLDNKSRIKLKRMRIYHPTEKVLYVGPEWFKRNKAVLAAKIPDWGKP